MVARIAASFVALVAASIVGATAVPRGDGSACNTGPIQCCEQLEKSNDPLSILSGLIGINCTPISVIGGGVGADCQQAPVCCQNNNVGGLISLGCVPVIL
ncbi:fungal hydrophobin [Trametes coccinea BRFM310]|uniref:Hydrophobin n=1 Tax=Trametes coccinea (strain BRFM310) TaxID=1353009 RepID=A0A1Y2J571_TRAC3|nr:fungal hydrophobin [Trametes coccinea BRFM310]